MWESEPFYSSGPVAGASYSFRGSGDAQDNSNVETYSIDIGPAAPDRLIVVGVAVQNGVSITSVTVNGIALNQDVTVGASSNTAAIFSGLVTSGSGPQNVVLTTATGAFIVRDVFVWRLTGLKSNLVKQTAAAGAGTNTISVTAGDLLFAVSCIASAMNFSGSTEVPSNQNNQIFGHAADWTVMNTTASFNIVSSVGTVNQVAATYR